MIDSRTPPKVGFVSLGCPKALVDQPFDGFSSVLDDKTGRLRVVEEASGDQCVADVIFGGVLSVEYGSDSSLGTAGGAIIQCAFADQSDLARLGQANRCRLSSQTASNYQNVKEQRHVGFLLYAEYSVQLYHVGTARFLVGSSPGHLVFWGQAKIWPELPD